MALKKKVTLQNGFEGDYWKVTSALLDKQRLIVEASIGLFKNQELANDPKVQPAKRLNVKFDIKKEDTNKDLVSLVYVYIDKLISKTISVGKFNMNVVIAEQLKDAKKA